MTTVRVKDRAALIVGRAAYCALDFGCGTVAQYVQSCYEVWSDDDRRTGVDSVERDEFRYQVLVALGTLGFSW